MFRRKDRDRRTSLTSPSSALPPPPPPGPPSHSARSASSSSYPDRDPSLRSATSPDPADSARLKRNSIFTWGSGNKAGGSSSPGADAGGRGSSGSPTTGGGLLGRTISRFSIAEEGPQHSAPPKGHLRRESSNLNPAAGGSSRGEEYTTSFSSLPTAHSTSPSPYPPAPVPLQQSDPRALKALQHSFDLLTSVQPEKVYRTAPPTVKSLVATGVDGRHPKTGPPGTPGNDWKETWLELRGVVLRESCFINSQCVRKGDHALTSPHGWVWTAAQTLGTCSRLLSTTLEERTSTRLGPTSCVLAFSFFLRQRTVG